MTTEFVTLQPRWLDLDGRCVGIRFECPCVGWCMYSPVTIFLQNPPDGGPPEGPETMRRTLIGERFNDLTLEPPIVLPKHRSLTIRKGVVHILRLDK